ncbi:MAG: DNA methyltransferase [Bifidobacterium bifidum]
MGYEPTRAPNTTTWAAHPARSPCSATRAKAKPAERPEVDGIVHPTVKPVALMRWLVRLVTPPNSLVLEPFAGSGATLEACAIENMRCTAAELSPEYVKLIRKRFDGPMQSVLF